MKKIFDSNKQGILLSSMFIATMAITITSIVYCLTPSKEKETIDNTQNNIEVETIEELNLTMNNFMDSYPLSNQELTTVDIPIQKLNTKRAEVINQVVIKGSIEDDEIRVLSAQEPQEIASEEQNEVEKTNTTTIVPPNHNSFKTYMSYKAITLKSSPHYKLQQIATTADNGIRMVDGRYCIAIGQGFCKKIGTPIDIVLENDIVIPCILGDCKAIVDTDENNLLAHNGHLLEFIVDTPSLSNETRVSGDISKAEDGWDAKIKKIIIYDTPTELQETYLIWG